MLMRIRLLSLDITSSLTGLKMSSKEFAVAIPLRTMNKPSHLLSLRRTHGLLSTGLPRVRYNQSRIRAAVAHAGHSLPVQSWSLFMLSLLVNWILSYLNNSLLIALRATVTKAATGAMIQPPMSTPLTTWWSLSLLILIRDTCRLANTVHQEVNSQSKITTVSHTRVLAKCTVLYKRVLFLSLFSLVLLSSINTRAVFSRALAQTDLTILLLWSAMVSRTVKNTGLLRTHGALAGERRVLSRWPRMLPQVLHVYRTGLTTQSCDSTLSNL